MKSQVYELKKNQIDADSIYGFLNAFNELYAECTDAEKKQFMQAFIERIDIFPERREDGNWIRNIRFQFPVPILRDGKEVVRVDGISLDKEKSDEHTVTLEKFPTLETVVLLSYKKPDGHINVKVEFGEGEGKVPLDNIAKRAEEYKPKERVTYKMIKEYIEAKYGFKVHTAYIAEVKRDLGLPMYDCELLKSCYRSCLELADENNVGSIAFCCISTGIFMFPNDRAAEIAVQMVQEYKAETGSKIEVVFNVFKEQDERIYRKLLSAD